MGQYVPFFFSLTDNLKNAATLHTLLSLSLSLSHSSLSTFCVCAQCGSLQCCSTFIRFLCLLFPSSPFHWATYNFYQVIKFSWNIFFPSLLFNCVKRVSQIHNWRLKNQFDDFYRYFCCVHNRLFKSTLCGRCEQSKELTPIQWDLQLSLFRIGLMIEILSHSFRLHWKSFDLNSNFVYCAVLSHSIL